MAKADTSRIEALDAILAEKRKHESYLEKLEARRESTPANVFARLRDEYLTKLTDLQVRASMEAESLAESLKEDEAAVAEIESRLAAIVEERIEGELRAEVGEYDPKDWGEKLKALNTSVSRIEKERDTKVASFERTRALLVEARGAVVESAPVEPPRVSVPTPAPVARMTPPPIPTQPAAPVVARTSAAEAMPAVPAQPPVVRPPTPVAPVAAVVDVPEVSAAPTEVAAAEPAPSQPKPAAPGAPMAGSPSFDELAFLNSVVGRVSVPLKAEPPAPRPSKPMSEIRDVTATKTPVPAAPVVPPRPTTTAKPPEPVEEPDSGPLGRPTPRTSQAIKTLKCQECGTLNYPTEWYCERCGGELAAL